MGLRAYIVGACLVCGGGPLPGGLRSHDAERHADHAHARDRAARRPTEADPVLEPWPVLMVEKPIQDKGPCETPRPPRRVRHLVRPTAAFLRRVGRAGGVRRAMMLLPGTVQWRRLQDHLANDAPLIPTRRRACS